MVPDPSAPGAPTAVGQPPERVTAIAAELELGRVRKVYLPRKAGRSAAAYSPSQAGKRIYVYDNGFVYADTKDTLAAFRWDEIATMFMYVHYKRLYGVKLPTKHLYTITRKDGLQIELTEFIGNVEQLAKTIGEQVAKAEYPKVAAAIGAGGAVGFGGRLGVCADGVMARTKVVPWADAKISIRNGRLILQKGGRWLPMVNVPVRRIPNLHLFLSVVASNQKRQSVAAQYGQAEANLAVGVEGAGGALGSAVRMPAR